MLKVTLTNTILNYITDIEKNRFVVSSKSLPLNVVNKLRKNSKKKSSFASNKIEGNPLTEAQASQVIDQDNHKHLFKPETEIRNYFLALNFLEKMSKTKKALTKELILKTQALVEKGAPSEKIGFRQAMPAGVLFAVYDSESGKPEYIPPDYKDVPALIDELIQYVNTTDDHPLIVAAVVHYQIVTIHPFEDGNGRTARLVSGYILDTNGYGFNGIGSLEEYFAYDVDEYYKSLQMDLPTLYYEGRNNPPHPEIWINYFLHMVQLYSNKVCSLHQSASSENVLASISHLNVQELKLLQFLLKNYMEEIKPSTVAKQIGVTNKTVINRLAKLARNGFVEPVLANERIMSYKLTEFSKTYRDEILNR